MVGISYKRHLKNYWNGLILNYFFLGILGCVSNTNVYTRLTTVKRSLVRPANTKPQSL